MRGGLRCGHAGLSEHPAHGAVMKSQLRGDGADDPMFDLIKPQDLGLDLARDHRAPPRSPATAQRPPSGESRQRTSTEAAAVRKGGHERVIRAGYHARIKQLKQPIERIADHGISLGIYLRDPDGNGVEIYYELPLAEWPVDYHVFSRDKVGSGRFPGPWDAEKVDQLSAPQAAVAA